MYAFYFHIRCIFLGVLILPICQSIANLFVILIAIITKKEFSQVFLPALNGIDWFSRETYVYFLFSGINLSAIQTLCLAAYSIYYIKHQSLKMMVFIWTLAGVLIGVLINWEITDTLFFDMINGFFLWSVAASALGYALAAYLIHLLMQLLMRPPNIKKPLVEIFK